LGRGNAEILEINIDSASGIAGKKVQEIRSENYTVIALFNDGELIIPTGETVLNVGDRILILTRVESLPKLEKLFKRRLVSK
jgi:Trk K+ transport system NAD-binding subunit